MKYEHLIGRPFEHGKTDCYTLIRDFFMDNYGISLTNYARPDNWWEDDSLDLYNDNYREEGFVPIEVRPQELRIADCFLMAVNSSKANHAAVYIGQGKILHHLYGKRSQVKMYGGIWRDMTVATLRNKNVPEVQNTLEKFDIYPLLPPVFKK